jgi:hypothetical protein
MLGRESLWDAKLTLSVLSVGAPEGDPEDSVTCSLPSGLIRTRGG